jgi:anti-anti-sigma factor
MQATREDRTMKVERQLHEGVTVVAVSESLEVDAGNAEAFRDVVLEAISDDRCVVLDASRVEFFDSAGMGVLLGIQKRLAAKNGTLVLAGLNRAILEIFQMVGFDVIFKICPDVSEAVATLQGS